jgi:hypothetical protein
VSLQDIAVSAANYCSQAIRARLIKASSSDGLALAKDDQAKTEQQAFAIGLQLRAAITPR